MKGEILKIRKIEMELLLIPLEKIANMDQSSNRGQSGDFRWLVSRKIFYWTTIDLLIL